MKSKDAKSQPISKKATRNPKAAEGEAAQEVKGRKAQSETAAARRNESAAAAGGAKRIQGHLAGSTRRRQGKRDDKNG